MAGIILFAIVFAFSFGQDVQTAPPAIQFEEPKAVQTDEGDPREFTLSYPSDFVSPYPENNIVPVHYFLPAEGNGPFPAVVVLHYWGASDLRIERTLSSDLAKKGIASIIVTLPYHLQRAPAKTRSGELAILPDPSRMIATMTQAVSDTRRAIDFLVSRPEIDSNRIAMTGTSLGSIVAALTVAVEPRIRSAAFMLGGVDLAHVLWHSSRVVSQRDGMRSRGYTEEKLRATLIGIEPLTYLKNRAPFPALIIGGKYDTVMPPEDTRKLKDAIPDSHIIWLDTGHYGGVFVQRRIIRTVTDFIAGDLLNKPYKIPVSLSAPTVRVGVSIDLDVGFQVGVGIDLFRANRNGDLLGSFFATPRGPALFLGARLTQGLAIGVMGKPRKITPALIWSTVL
jgi:dienelactone hydrolase